MPLRERAVELAGAGDAPAIVRTVQSDLGTLQGLGATPETDSAAAIAAGDKALKSAANAIAWANQTGNGIDNQAQQLATTAQNWANQHGC
jgi:hypothetical protein